VLALIFQGKIVDWNDPEIAKLNPGVKLPDQKIVTIHRTDGSGDTFIFTQYLSASAPAGRIRLATGRPSLGPRRRAPSGRRQSWRGRRDEKRAVFHRLRRHQLQDGD